ncbi:hypothetical protein FZEAL_4794 [Fusarium zealandicum]|uniref:BTB domain-containing protein n=1 Tax=Fusarium zealandicum TaxID=1053134 RepID=A0A8H4XL81_9HYPO|nr:hypothetical protein FZEAL_4794 [Fusarium zealandicum]
MEGGTLPIPQPFTIRELRALRAFLVKALALFHDSSASSKHLTMAPAKKRARTTRSTPKEDAAPDQPSTLADFRTAWLVKSDDQMVELKAKGESFRVAKRVLTKNSEYFEGCFNGQFSEAKKGVVDFEDEIEPQYLGLYIGLAYSHSSIVPHGAPRPSKFPEAEAPKTPMRDYVEVFKLCDRFISPAMGNYIERCIDVAIGDGHRALRRTQADEGMQKVLIRDFADGYEALEMVHDAQKQIGDRMMLYFCEGVSYSSWVASMEEVMDRQRFVGHVSRGFADTLKALQEARKLKRKELAGPGAAGP